MKILRILKTFFMVITILSIFLKKSIIFKNIALQTMKKIQKLKKYCGRNIFNRIPNNNFYFELRFSTIWCDMKILRILNVFFIFITVLSIFMKKKFNYFQKHRI